MAVIQGITANVIVDGEPLEEFNEGDDIDNGVDSDSDSDDDQRYIDDQKARQDLVNPSRPKYPGPSRQVTKYIPSATDAEFSVTVSLSQSRIQRLKSRALSLNLFVDGNRVSSTVWEKRDGDSQTFEDVIVATPAGPFRKPFLFSEIITSKYDIDLGKH